MKTVKVFANTFNLGVQKYDALLSNVEKVYVGKLGWNILLNCGTEVILPSSTIFTIEDSK